MLISQAHLQGIAAGTITLAFRRWHSPTVKAGGSLRTPIGVLAIEAVDVVQANDITGAMAEAAGFASREELVAELAKRPDGAIYRVRLRLAGPDPRVALRNRAELSDGERAEVLGALERLDRFSKAGPWTQAVLTAIDRHPGRLAARLASSLGMERAWFKAQVRKLKELGLTESLEVGYRLSARGKALLGGGSSGSKQR
jgi:hypothetical protein